MVIKVLRSQWATRLMYWRKGHKVKLPRRVEVRIDFQATSLASSMTVTYYPQIATIKFASTFKLLVRWKGSLYKLVLPDVGLFIGLYLTLSFIHRYALNEEQKDLFDNICIHAREYSGTTTVTFCLGFFVSYVLVRWWEYFKTMPWMFNIGFQIRQTVVPPCLWQRLAPAQTGTGGVQTYADVLTDAQVTEQCAEALRIRLNLIRYLLVSWIWMMRRISKPVLVRFKPHENLQDSTLLDKLKVMNGDPYIQKFLPVLLTDTEIAAIVEYAKRVAGDDYEKYEPDHFIPASWAADQIQDARARGYIANKMLEKELMIIVRDFRAGLGMLRFMDMFNVPLVYTQVVALCLHIYFILNCFATQFTDHEKPDMYIPLPFILQLMFLFGWLRVSEVCLNPLGEDDDDFPTWRILNMNLETAFKMVNVFDHCLIGEVEPPYLQSRRQIPADSALDCNGQAQAPRAFSVENVATVTPTRRISVNSTHSAAVLDSNFHGKVSKLHGSTCTALLGSGNLKNPEANSRRTSSLAVPSHDEAHDELAQLQITNYNKNRKKYDRPFYEGSAMQNELNSRTRTSRVSLERDASPSSSALNLNGPQLVSNLLQLPAKLALSRRSSIAGSRNKLEASKFSVNMDAFQASNSNSNSNDHEASLVRPAQSSFSVTAYSNIQYERIRNEDAGTERRVRHLSVPYPLGAVAVDFNPFLKSTSTHPGGDPSADCASNAQTQNSAPVPQMTVTDASGDLHKELTVSVDTLRKSSVSATDKALLIPAAPLSTTAEGSGSLFSMHLLADGKRNLNSINEAAEPSPLSSSSSADSPLTGSADQDQDQDQDTSGSGTKTDDSANSKTALVSSRSEKKKTHAAKADSGAHTSQSQSKALADIHIQLHQPLDDQF